MSGKRVLYITYDGLLDPLGRSQVLSYLSHLSTAGHKIIIVSYEKRAEMADTRRFEALRAEVAGYDIHWIALPYHKTPTVPATAFDAFVGVIFCSFLVLRHGIEIIHARSYIPALIALILKAVWRRKFIFDMRGFWADERVADGFWRENSLIFRMVKRLETAFFTRADAVVSLTHAAVKLIQESPAFPVKPARFVVIPTCVDLERFAPSRRPDSAAPFTLGCIGSMERYRIQDIVRFLNILRGSRPDARLLFISRGPYDALRKQLSEAGLPPGLVSFQAARHEEMPALIGTLSAGIFFVPLSFAKQAMFPTKLGELLACGVPCVTNSGTGDFADIVRREGAGVVLQTLDDAEMRQASASILALAAAPQTQSACREAARRHLSLETGVAAYDQLYRTLR